MVNLRLRRRGAAAAEAVATQEDSDAEGAAENADEAEASPQSTPRRPATAFGRNRTRRNLRATSSTHVEPEHAPSLSAQWAAEIRAAFFGSSDRYFLSRARGKPTPRRDRGRSLCTAPPSHPPGLPLSRAQGTRSPRARRSR
jgi:hypothetical protein